MYSHGASSTIPQPPHSAGIRYPGLRAAIQPEQVPSPLDAIDADMQRWEWDGEPYLTLPGSRPPLSTTDFVAIDQGNSSPKFARMSTWNIPNNSRLALECAVPMAMILQPLAELAPNEEPVPLVDPGPIGPARCAQCRGYVNPWCTWVAGGMRWKCNLCNHETQVTPEYQCGLDANYLRLDHLQRPELNKGTVDFVVSEEYWAPHPPPSIRPLFYSPIPLPTDGTRTPCPMDYVFVLDVCYEAVQSGYLSTACSTLLELLYGNGDTIPPCFPESGRICIIAYDRTLQFYNLSSEIVGHPPLLAVGDLDEVFLPSVSGLFVRPNDRRDSITALLTTLSSRPAEQAIETQAALGSALCASLAALAGRGGQVIAFMSIYPAIGLGSFKPREDEAALYGTDKEKTLFIPREELWTDLGKRCAAEGVGVSMFLGMSRPIDLGTIGVVTNLSGGELFFHPRFDRQRDGPVLASQFRHVITRTTAYNCSMRVRTSSGLRVTDQLGHGYEGPAGDLEFGTIDSDKTLAVKFEHARRMDDARYAYIQAALLYTTAAGQRRVRVFNLALPVVTLAGNVFQYADMDATLSYMVREAVVKMPHEKISYITDALTECCSSILYGYRKNCAASAAPTQLVIGEMFRAFPLYTLGILKTRALKGVSVASDLRTYRAHKLMAMSARSIMQHLYPRLLAVHDLDNEIALPNAEGRIEMPSLMRDSYTFMEAHGVYLADNEDVMVFWIGASVSPQLLRDLFDVDDLSQVDVHMLSLPVLDTRLSKQVRNILARRHEQRGYTPKLLFARQNMDGAEIEFSDMLVEDQNNGAMSYIDYLCVVHKQISKALENGGSISGGGGFRSMPW